MSKIEIVNRDITTINVDAIVNAANTSLLGGGGVDGVIHSEAGEKLLEECKELKGCKTGRAKLTDAYKLPAKHIIHAVGPIWRGGNSNEKELLASAYTESLKLADKNKLKSIAFPNISTGIYGFPKEEAAKIVYNAIHTYLNKGSEIEAIVFCIFDNENLEIYNRLFKSY